MANSIIIPQANPIRFVPEGAPAYRNFDAQWYREYVLPYQKPDDYFQKWIAGTQIRLQFHSNFGPLTLQLMDCAGSVLQTIVPTAVETDLYDTGYTTYEATFLPVINPGTWFVVLIVGFEETEEVFISEPQITPTDISGLITVEYFSNFNDGGMVYATGIKPIFVVEAVVDTFLPKSKRTVWEDQPLNLKTIMAIPYRQFKLILGNAYGVPDWVVDKMNRIFCCSSVTIDGVQYTQVEGAEWEPTRVDRYSRAGWRLDIRPTRNLQELRGENNNSPAQTFAVVYNIDTRVFGTFNGNVNSNILQITSVQD